MSRTEEAEPKRIPVQDAVCQFALRRAIDDVLDDLIVAGADKVVLLKNNRRYEKLALSRSQIKNVVNEAADKRSRQAVTNFIRYQMGRQGGEAWRNAAAGRRAFGLEVIADIESGESHASRIDVAALSVCAKVIEDLRRRNRTTDEAELKREAQAQLTALYLGYLNRTYAYCEALDKENDKTCWVDVERIAKQKGGAA